MSAWNPASERQVSNTFLVALLSYLERAGGDELVGEVLAEAGCDRSRPDLVGATWGARDDVLALAEVAAGLTGDPDIGRRVGEELFRMNTADPTTTAFFVSLGSPAAALQGVLEHTVKLGRGRSYEMVSNDDSGCVIRGEYESVGVSHPFFCGLSLGYWPMLAGLFGAVGTGTHPTCQCRGDECCTFVIRWDRGAEADRSVVAAADAELRQRLGTFEEMQLVAEELARAADLPALAEKILDAVDIVTPAPQLLVAIRPQDDKPPVVAWRGMTARTARPLATSLLCGSYSGRIPIMAMAPLGRFGLVAAIAPDARAPSETSSRLLEAFARHAGARVEAVISRQLAEESRQTASALLLLARSLSETTTEQEVSDCVASAIPKLVGADHAAVLRWNPETYSLRTVAHAGLAGVTPHEEFTVNEVPALCEVASRPAPVVIDRPTARGYIRRVMDEIGESINIVVPLVEQGDFLGFVCAGYRSETGLDRDAAYARLQGTADLAATAFTKARLLDEIRHQALHDDLTGLPNRVLLEDRVDQALREAKRNGTGLAVLFLDLDRFKHVNDSMGHEFGDVLIQAATGRMRQALRECDVFARVGGDEFVIGLPGVKAAADGAKVADKILEDLRQPFEIGDQTLYISASIGLALYPDDGDDYATLLQAADISMYAAKDSGRNTIRRRPPRDARAESQKRLLLETELHRAIEGNELEVVYQPQVAMADLRMTGVEALVRWPHRRLGYLEPAGFLPVAEDCGLMPQLDRLVRRAALAQAQIWHSSIGPLIVAVNLSAQDIRRPGLLEEIESDLALARVDPEQVEVELTEGMVTDDDLIPVVEGLAAMGLRVAIDDFGTGSSVFARLQVLPVHRLKIDRSLVQGREAGRDSSFLGAIIEMSHSLGIEVVAEGVENPVQAGHLRRSGCDAAQGYLFGLPAGGAEIAKILYSQVTTLDRPGRAGRAALREATRPRPQPHSVSRS